MEMSCFDDINLYDSAVIKGLSFKASGKFRPFANMFSDKVNRWCWCRDSRNTSVFDDFPMAFIRPVSEGISDDDFAFHRGNKNPYNNVYTNLSLSIFDMTDELYKTGPKSVSGDHIAAEGKHCTT